MRWLNNYWSPQTIIFLLVVVFIGGYALSRSWNLIAGPQLEIISPPAGEIHTDSLITVSGEAKRVSKLFMNGAQIFTNTKGEFNQTLLLLPGYNIIVLEAEDRFGRRVINKISLINQEA